MLAKLVVFYWTTEVELSVKLEHASPSALEPGAPGERQAARGAPGPVNRPLPYSSSQTLASSFAHRVCLRDFDGNAKLPGQLHDRPNALDLWPARLVHFHHIVDVEPATAVEVVVLEQSHDLIHVVLVDLAHV